MPQSRSRTTWTLNLPSAQEVLKLLGEVLFALHASISSASVCWVLRPQTSCEEMISTIAYYNVLYCTKVYYTVLG